MLKILIRGIIYHRGGNMNNHNTSFKKDNKEVKIIDFIPFEDRNTKISEIKINKTKKNNINKSYKKTNKVFVVILLIAIIIGFILSAHYNVYEANKNRSVNYKKINVHKSTYAKIKSSDRINLLRKIGFDIVKLKNEKLGSKNYPTTYAYRKNGDYSDYITVYYDNNSVKYIMLELSYNKVNFSYNKLLWDSDAIINNFITVSLEKKDIDKLLKKKYIIINRNNVKITYKVTSKDTYYIISITVE